MVGTRQISPTHAGLIIIDVFHAEHAPDAMMTNSWKKALKMIFFGHLKSSRCSNSGSSSCSTGEFEYPILISSKTFHPFTGNILAYLSHMWIFISTYFKIFQLSSSSIIFHPLVELSWGSSIPLGQVHHGERCQGRRGDHQRKVTRPASQGHEVQAKLWNAHGTADSAQWMVKRLCSGYHSWKSIRSIHWMQIYGLYSQLHVIYIGFWKLFSCLDLLSRCRLFFRCSQCRKSTT